MLRAAFILLAALSLGTSIATAQVLATKPLSPSEAQKRFQIEPGLQIELIAPEPLVQSPAAIAWDEANRLFVAENSGYPVGPDPGEPPVGKIVELRDTNGDGTPDERIVFATGMQFPNGLMPWRGGWLVTDAPHLYWLSDTNRDSKADTREIWFTGFATNQTTQLRACYPILGPDGWIYVSRGWSGGRITSPKWTNLNAVDLKLGDFRFRPDGSAAEAIGGNAQFGMVLDDVGRRFLTSNRNPIMQAMALPQWWTRMPSFYFTDTVQDVSPVGAEAKVFPISADLTTSGFMPELMSAPHAGTFTSACGLHQYFGEALASQYQGSWFICEPAQNLVQRQVARSDGPGFRSSRAPEGSDFLASSDTWFHPVYTATGPDGALYVADMYRNFIDHPEYLPKDARAKIDFNAGKDRGRIWRIYSSRPVATPASRAHASRSGLVAALNSSNVWRRQTAHRLVIERPENELALQLIAEYDAQHRVDQNGSERPFEKWAASRLAEDPSSGLHLGRTRAIRLLGDLLLHHRKLLETDTLTRSSDLLFRASFDPSPSVREAAFRVFQAASDRHNPIPEAGDDILKLWANDPNAAVRYHLAYILGNLGNDDRFAEALVTILRRDAGNRWTRAVVLSGLEERMHPFAMKWFAHEWTELPGLPPQPFGFDDSEPLVTLALDMGRVYGNAGGAGTEIFLQYALAETADGSAWQAALLTGLFQSGDHQMKQRILKSTPARLKVMRERHTANALDATLSTHRRVASIQFLGQMPGEKSDALLPLMVQPQALDLQLAAARALVQSLAELPAAVLQEWHAFRPELREILLDFVVSKPSLHLSLLEAVDRGDIPKWHINANRKRILLQSANPVVSQRAVNLLGSTAAGDRQKAFEEHKLVLAMKGSSAKGQTVFLNLCASCHQHRNDGYKVGPDLTSVRNQPAEALLYHIIVPDAEVYPGFQNYEVETSDGEHYNGLLAGETDTAVTLVQALGEKQQIDRSQIARFRGSAFSLMPNELEKAMSHQELADLLAFLKAP